MPDPHDCKVIDLLFLSGYTNQNTIKNSNSVRRSAIIVFIKSTIPTHLNSKLTLPTTSLQREVQHSIQLHMTICSCSNSQYEKPFLSRTIANFDPCLKTSPAHVGASSQMKIWSSTRTAEKIHASTGRAQLFPFNDHLLSWVVTELR